MEPDGGQTEVRDRAYPDRMFLVALQLRQVNANRGAKRIAGSSFVHLTSRLWAPTKCQAFSQVLEDQQGEVSSVHLQWRGPSFCLQAGLSFSLLLPPSNHQQRNLDAISPQSILQPHSSSILDAIVFFLFFSYSCKIFCLASFQSQVILTQS